MGPPGLASDGSSAPPGEKHRCATATSAAERHDQCRAGRAFVERVNAHRERVVITRNGSTAAVMMSPDDLESLEETLAVLNDREAVAELAEAYRACAEGSIVRGVEAVRALRPS
ncbi:MAG: type II toxin-antitoxin system Phd/YefM family antitoxin [Acidimicrobiaceae bacterium]|nr:type II toxin-antitoxin system Phd/YefM family antitoxin [Acidimicrobiaceae bacterium]MYI14355.1 type II toxin-antitoxin system Phd/YefM family antitoxin [Acidimicrobiaceae bacterium]